jgi:DNA helicase-2/ATP-dependent DNA helicase PcrA
MREIKLNKAQRAAVEHIYGPLLVIAGPGTGKTQLLSSRVAHILQETDASPRNILCLTFTESGAQNMRERLRSLVGDAAYEVTISTYHSFGSDIIKNYAEHFQSIGLERSEDIRMERPLDDLTQIQIVENIINKLSFDSTLLSARYYIKSVVGTISDLKQNLISPEKLREIAKENLLQIEKVQPLIDSIINEVGGISRKKEEKLTQYNKLLEELSYFEDDLVKQAVKALESAHKQADELNSPTPLTAWKNDWLYKNENDEFVFTEPLKSEKMIELASVYEAYENELKKRAAYDYDDMILRAIEGIKTNDELRYNLQERYQFILLDEFQDTNPSQFELVKRIADHPVHEGKPNIMAVGDDDQAIFAFQGANIGNMQEYLEAFSQVTVVNLTENYRSHPDILYVAHNISGQIQDRLHHKLDNIDKVLTAGSSTLPKNASISRHEFASEAQEYGWVARQISNLVDSGVKASEIAVLAPKHRILAGIVPFLKQSDIPMSYEKRENILETEIVQGLRLTAKLLQALSYNNVALTNEYFPLVLSLPYWQLEPIDIWQINWQFAKVNESRTWAEIAIESKELKSAVEFYLHLSNRSSTEPLEITLDTLIGTKSLETTNGSATAPLKDYYFAVENRETNAFKYYEAISHLSVIRSKLRDMQSNSDTRLTLDDFLNMFTMYEAAETPLLNTHPIAQNESSVQLMTAYKAKGLEFEHVFILQAHDDVWGSSSKGGNNKLSLPINLSHIRYANSSDDERRRLFFVAVTRAKHGLYISSHAQKDSGKKTTPLKYLAETDGFSAHLPEYAQKILSDDEEAEQISKDIETLWQAGQVSLPADFKALLKDRIASYKMSPTHLNTFIDLERGGPEAFLVQTLLRFPQAPSASGEFGTAIHNTLEWYQNNSANNPNIEDVLIRFENEINRRYLAENDREYAKDKGLAILRKYIKTRKDMFNLSAKAEVNFYQEGVHIENALISGKIDRLEINEEEKTVQIVDFKTGKPLKKWNKDLKSLKYKQQLYMYKFLIEGSSTWKKYKVESARLEFVEPDKNGVGDVQPALYVEFNDNEENEIKKLIVYVWNIINSLDLPDISEYSDIYKDVVKFIESLSK